MDPRYIQDLRKAILKHRRAGALGNKDPGPSIDAPRIEALGGGPSIPDVPKNPLSIKERVQASFGQ